MTEKVSIIIKCFNNEAVLENNINSALSQTYKNIEIICIDDGLNDNCKEIIKAHTTRNENINLIFNNKNKNSAHSRNLAIKICKGKYILSIDNNITLERNFVEEAVKVLSKNPDVGLVYSKGLTKEILDEKNKVSYPVMFRKSDFLDAGKYNTLLSDNSEDYDLWINIIEQGYESYELDLS